MNLKDVIASIVYETVQGMQPSDMFIGTVSSVNPLEVKLDSGQAAIKAPILYRTDSVIERKFKLDYHAHSTGSGSTGAAKSNVSGMIDGKPMETQAGYIIINKGLAVGDKVLLMAVQGGQKYIILSHIN